MKKILLICASLFLLYSANTNAQSTLNEGFETWPPSGWQTYLNGEENTRGWRDDFSNLSYTGTGSAHTWISNKQQDNWLVTHAITVLNSNYQLKFWEISDGIEFYAKNSVLISSGSSNPADGDYFQLYEANSLNEVWEQRIIDLSAFNGQTIYIAFRYESPVDSWHKWNLDDVSVGPASFSDAALATYISPVGVSETPVINPVTVTVQNLGTTVITDFDITWTVNNVAQTTFTASALTLQPGESTDVTIGTYDFSSEAAYYIRADVVLTNDFDSANNSILTTFEVSSFKDGGVTAMSPEGMKPNPGNYDITITLENLGDNTINIAEIPWAVDGSNQIPYFTNSLNLVPGETREITLGQYNLTAGVHLITATFAPLGEINYSNNYYQSRVAVDTFWESFEGAEFPPEGWSMNYGVRDDRRFGTPVEGDHYYASFSEDDYFGKANDTLYTPLLEIKNGDRFKFYLQTSLKDIATHTLVYKHGTTGDVQVIQSIENTPGFNNWEQRDIDISSAVGNNYIGIVTERDGGYAQTSFDLMSSDAKLFFYDKDLKIANGDMYFLAKQNTSETFTCEIKNNGVLPVLGTEYTVKLMEAPNTELASVNGVNIDPSKDTEIAINHTFSTISEKRLFFKIDYADDENTINNTFREANVSVVPNTVETIVIGENISNLLSLDFPFDNHGDGQTLGTDDINQALYYSNEINSAGYIHGIAYEYNNILKAEAVKYYPLKVSVKQTNVVNMENGWIPQEELIVVFDGVVEILPGDNRDLYIPFSAPVLINGIDNIVIQNYQYSPDWPPAIIRWKMEEKTDADPIRTIGLSNYYDLDPNDLPELHSSQTKIINTRFVVDPTTTFSELSGIVYNSDTSNPIADATVSVVGSSISVQTNANGNYTLPELPYGQFSVEASKIGFLAVTTQVDLNTATQIQDFNIGALPEIEVTGSVFGDNNMSVPLESVDVLRTEDGLEIETVITDNNGGFIFPIVYGGSDYEITISLYGYYPQTIEITAIDSNIDLGDIILVEEFISPFDVNVVTDTDPTINWKSPKLSDKVKLQHDFNEESTAFTNEPDEEVWLGNYFLIDETTTITSVEFKTGKYENATDYVTVDIFDMATFKVISSSEPFLIYKDSLHTISVPNIVVNENIAAMIHWKDNVASTNMLAIDFSDDIFNGGVITYPKDDIYLFSDYIGAPIGMSFIMRINTLDDGTPVTNTEAVSYNVYRGLDSDFPDMTMFNKINISPVADVSMVDDTAGFDPTEFYRYAVETIYVNGTSEVTFSNTVSGASLDVDDFQFINDEVLLFPNPAKEKITIQLGSNLQTSKPIEIYNVLGKKVITIKSTEIVNGRVTQNVTTLKSGMYFMKIDINGISINRKFIVN